MVIRKPIPLPPVWYQHMLRELAAERKRQGYSQIELAEKIGVNAQLVGKWECLMRNPSAFHLRLWCEVLGVTLKVSKD